MLDWIFASWRHFIATVLFVVVPLAIVFAWYEYGTERTVTFTVKSLDDQATGRGGGHQYLIFTTDGRVFKNTDALFHGKTDSSNVEAMLNVGSTYRCPVYGNRIFLLSSYPDVLDGCQLVRK